VQNFVVHAFLVTRHTSLASFCCLCSLFIWFFSSIYLNANSVVTAFFHYENFLNGIICLFRGRSCDDNFIRVPSQSQQRRPIWRYMEVWHPEVVHNGWELCLKQTQCKHPYSILDIFLIHISRTVSLCNQTCIEFTLIQKSHYNLLLMNLKGFLEWSFSCQ